MAGFVVPGMTMLCCMASFVQATRPFPPLHPGAGDLDEVLHFAMSAARTFPNSALETVLGSAQPINENRLVHNLPSLHLRGIEPHALANPVCHRRPDLR